MSLSVEEITEREKKAREILKKNGIDETWWETLTQQTEKETRQLLEESELEISKTLSAKDLLGKQFPKTTWLVENLIPSEGFTAITGTPASYKSFLTEHLAVCLSSDKLFLGHFKVTQTPLLIIDKENPLSLLQERFIKLGLTESALVFFLQQPDAFQLKNQADLDWTINFIKENHIGLVILDSFAHIHKGDENDSQEIVKTFELLKKLPCASVFIHHHRKTIKFFTGTPLESIRGSSDIAAELESHLAVDITSSGIRIAQYKNRRGELTKPFMVNALITDTTVSFTYSGEIEEEVSKIKRARDLIIELLSNGELPRQKILQGLSDTIGRNSTDQAIRKMEQDNELKIRYEGRAKVFSLSPYVSPEQGDTSLSSLEQSYLEETS